MGAAYSQDLRNRVLAADDRGMRTKQLADVFAVSPAWVRRVKQRRRETGEIRPRPMGGPGPRKIDRTRLAEQPDATLWELRDRLDVGCSESGVGAALKKMGRSFKKRRSMRQSRTGRTSPSAGPSGGVGSPIASSGV